MNDEQLEALQWVIFFHGEYLKWLSAAMGCDTDAAKMRAADKRSAVFHDNLRAKGLIQ